MQVAGCFGPSCHPRLGSGKWMRPRENRPETRRRRGQGLISTVDSGGQGHEGGRDSLRRPSIQAGESPAPRPLPESGQIAVP